MKRSILSVVFSVAVSAVTHVIGLFAVFGSTTPMFWSERDIYGYALSLGAAALAGSFVAAYFASSHRRPRPWFRTLPALPVSALVVYSAAADLDGLRRLAFGSAGILVGVWLAVRKRGRVPHMVA